MGFSFFKQRKPRQFNLKYRYYDEQKERIAQSEARVRKKLGLDGEDDKPERLLKYGVFRNSVESAREDKKRMMRMGVIIGLLLIFAYTFFYYAG
ncbi:MAG: hypothetical protein J6U24_07725 [Paludibacteraceae bacterium]|nr:hypothetical protein [Paludibacteraceae bacterium]